MREILFRGKRVDNGEWVEGCYIKGVKACYGKLYILPENINQPGCHHLDGFQVDPESTGQFTGFEFCDKKCFEGDLIETVNMSTGDKYVWLITWKYGAWYAVDNTGEEIQIHDFSEDSDYPEIIGNIHDNQELKRKK